MAGAAAMSVSDCHGGGWPHNTMVETRREERKGVGQVDHRQAFLMKRERHTERQVERDRETFKMECETERDHVFILLLTWLPLTVGAGEYLVVEPHAVCVSGPVAECCCVSDTEEEV